MIERFAFALRVRFNECDPQGIVFNANYAVYVDIAFTEMWREIAGSYAGFVRETGVDVVTAELSLRYRASATFDEELEIVLTPRRSSRSSITSAWTISRGDTLLVEGSVRHVCVDAQSFEKVPAPPLLERAIPSSG